MTENTPSPDADLDERLRAAVSIAAPDAPAVGVLDAVERRVVRRRRRVREAAAACLVIVAGGGVAVGLGLDSGPRGTFAGPAAATTSTSTTNPQSATAAQAQGMGPGLSDRGEAPPTAPPCKAGQRTPSAATGSYCGPAPHAGNGSGPNGTCTGNETVPPCGPGAVPGRYYAYTEPGTCSGLIFFDGKQWVSELPPPTPAPDSYVWIGLGTKGTLGWISPDGAVGFQPYVGQALKECE